MQARLPGPRQRPDRIRLRHADSHADSHADGDSAANRVVAHLRRVQAGSQQSHHARVLQPSHVPPRPPPIRPSKSNNPPSVSSTLDPRSQSARGDKMPSCYGMLRLAHVSRCVADRRGYFLTMNQSDAGSAGICFSRWTNQTQEARTYSHDGPIGRPLPETTPQAG
eukprot:575435-Prorocentrum_minimum.AAC.1